MASSAPPPPADNPYHDPALPPPDNSRHHGQALPPPVASVLLVPRARVGRVIGRAGETIRALQTYTGASIQIAQESDPCRVVLAGPPPAVALAECLVRDIVAGCFKGFALLRQQAGAGAEARHPDTRPAYLPGYGLVPPSALAEAVSYLAEGREGARGGGFFAAPMGRGLLCGRAQPPPTQPFFVTRCVPGSPESAPGKVGRGGGRYVPALAPRERRVAPLPRRVRGGPLQRAHSFVLSPCPPTLREHLPPPQSAWIWCMGIKPPWA